MRKFITFGKNFGMSITVIGESNIDVAIRKFGPDREGGCTPADIRFHHGGVARNVAYNLSLLGQKVRLMTVFGGDGFANQMMEDCMDVGIDLSLSTRFEDAKSPVFLSFNDPQGNMLSAVSDIGLNDRMDLDWVMAKIGEINRSDIVVADTLLSSEALAFLIDHVEAPLYMDAVSPKRALRIAEALEKSEKKSFQALKCNLDEAQAITGINKPQDASKALNVMGIHEVFITLGANGAVYSSLEKTLSFPALPAKVVNATGSGDAFLSGIVYAHANGILAEKAVLMGLEAARITTESERPCSMEIGQLAKTSRSFPNMD